MSYMKKPFKVTLFVALTLIFLSLSIIAIIVSIKRKDNSYYYLAVEKNHYLLNNENELKINLYSSHSEDEYLKKENICKSYIENTKTSDYYEVSIQKINQEKQEILFEKRAYFGYQISVIFPLTNCDYLQIEQAKLVLSFETEEKRTFPIGNLIINQIETTDSLNLTYLKGVVNQMDEVPILKGIGVEFRKNYNEEIKIVSIESLDKRVKVKNNIAILNNKMYDNELKIEELKNTIVDEETCFPFSVLENTSYFIELDYDSLQMITTLGFIVTYEMNGIVYKQYMMPFQYFNSSIRSYQSIQYE